MRVLAVLTLSTAALLLPQLVAADPAQPAQTPVATSQPAAPAAQTAPATPQMAQATTSPAEPAENLDEIVCKTTPPPTGTRLGGGRECHTAREWNERMQASQDMVKQTQMNGHLGALNGGKP